MQVLIENDVKKEKYKKTVAKRGNGWCELLLRLFGTPLHSRNAEIIVIVAGTPR